MRPPISTPSERTHMSLLLILFPGRLTYRPDEVFERNIAVGALQARDRHVGIHCGPERSISNPGPSQFGN